MDRLVPIGVTFAVFACLSISCGHAAESCACAKLSDPDERADCMKKCILSKEPPWKPLSGGEAQGAGGPVYGYSPRRTPGWHEEVVCTLRGKCRRTRFYCNPRGECTYPR